MPEAIEDYISQPVAGRMRRRAVIVWSIAAFLVFLWVVSIMLAPLAAANNLTSVSNSLYKFFGFLCHQDSARSYAFGAHVLAVCSRCFGIYFGLFGGFLVYPFLRQIEETEPFPRFWLFAAMVPMAVDWLLGVFGVWENTHFSRFLTGAILGAACAVYIIPALIEIFRLLPNKRRVKRLPT